MKPKYVTDFLSAWFTGAITGGFLIELAPPKSDIDLLAITAVAGAAYLAVWRWRRTTQEAP